MRLADPCGGHVAEGRGGREGRAHGGRGWVRGHAEGSAAVLDGAAPHTVCGDAIQAAFGEHRAAMSTCSVAVVRAERRVVVVPRTGVARMHAVAVHVAGVVAVKTMHPGSPVAGAARADVVVGPRIVAVADVRGERVEAAVAVEAHIVVRAA